MLCPGRNRVAARPPHPRPHCTRNSECHGKNIISMGPALGHTAWLHTRALFADISSTACWGHHVAISHNEREELLYWKNLPKDHFKGQTYPKDETPTAFLVFFFFSLSRPELHIYIGHVGSIRQAHADKRPRVVGAGRASLRIATLLFFILVCLKLC
jgi:hypothetical protein